MITGRKEEDEAARSRAGTKISLFIALFGSCVVLFSIRKSDAQINFLILKVYHSNGLDGLKDIYLDGSILIIKHSTKTQSKEISQPD